MTHRPELARELVIATEARFHRNASGSVCADTESTAYDFWTRYLEVFDRVTVLARVSDKPMQNARFRVEGPHVSVLALPYYVGPAAFLRQLPPLGRALLRAYTPQSAYLARVPGIIGALLLAVLAVRRHPFGLEVVGDPHDVFAPGTLRHPLSPILRAGFSRTLRSQCRRAVAVSYVSERVLARRYPPGEDTFVTSYSSIDLEPDAFAKAPRTYASSPDPLTIVNVGTFAQPYKGQHVLMHAQKLCRDAGLDVRVRLVGGGKLLSRAREEARELGLADDVAFLGQVPASEVRHHLQQSDLFVLPSLTEGLPRALIEAMAQALPCIASDIGGIPDLLPKEYLVRPGDAQQLAQTIGDLASSPSRLTRASEENLSLARNYAATELRQRRAAFYRELRDRTAGMLARRS
jgi:phosphatidyl-myo-inositol dimannoside synthase